MRKTLSAVAFFTVLAVSGTAFGQFGGLGGGSPAKAPGKPAASQPKGAGSVTKEDVLKEKDQASNDYLESARSFTKANIFALKALGCKEEAEKLEADTEKITSGATKKTESLDLANQMMGRTRQADDLVNKNMAAKSLKDAESIAHFSNSLGHFVNGVRQLITLGKRVAAASKNAQTLIAAASPLDKPGLAGAFKPVVDMATMVPQDLQAATATLVKYVEFCKSNGIKVPDDVSDLLPQKK
jgi:hypothetical protein